MERVNKICVGVTFALMALIFGHCLGYKQGKKAGRELCRTDTLVRVDTVLKDRPVEIRSTLVRVDTVVLNRVNEVKRKQGTEPDAMPQKPDTAVVSIGIESKVYGDSTYRAWVSGYMASLDSICVYPRTVFVTEREVRQKPPNRWGLTLTAGAGYVPGVGMKPFLGVGISYTLWPWK